MECIHPSKAIDGLDYNRETADRMLMTKTVTVSTCARNWKLEIDLPAYMFLKLRTHDWDTIQLRIAAFAEQKEREAIISGAEPGMVEVLIGVALKKAIYDHFIDAQQRAGNAAWAVPFTVFRDQYPGVRNA